MKKLLIALLYSVGDWIFSFACISGIVFIVVYLIKTTLQEEDGLISTGALIILFFISYLLTSSVIRKWLVNRFRVLVLRPSKEDLEEMKVKRT